MSKRFVLILLAMMAIFVGLLLLGGRDAKAPSNDDVKPTSHRVGQGTDGVTLVEYGDFQCPACAIYYNMVKEVKQKYGERITFQFRHFPLTQIHPNAFAAHRAAEAAGRQDKFFEMHDLLYERQSSWQAAAAPTSLFEGFAEELDLDMDRYRQDFGSADVNRVIRADMAAGNAANATSTPTFVLNGQKIDENPRDIDGFTRLIDAAIAAAKNSQ